MINLVCPVCGSHDTTWGNQTEFHCMGCGQGFNMYQAHWWVTADRVTQIVLERPNGKNDKTRDAENP